MGRKKTKCWRFSAGERPFTVEVYEVRPGGSLYVRAWDTSLGKRVVLPLKHHDRDAAMEHAKRESSKLAAGAIHLAPSPQLGYILMQYLVHRTPQKPSEDSRRSDRRRAELWTNVLGAQRRIATLGSAEWYGFIRERTSGAIDARGRRVPENDKDHPRRAVGEASVDADLVFIVAVLNWATSWMVNGLPVLDRNPWAAASPGVRRALARPRNRSPKRPVATYDRFLAVRNASEQVMMEAHRREPGAAKVEVGRAKYRLGERPVVKWMRPSYLPELLDLVEDTGRRISAICRLWYSDFIIEGGQVTMIRWRPFKAADEQIVPIGERARAAVKRILAARPGIGDTPVFPSSRRGKTAKEGEPTAIGKRTATDWLLAAEAIAHKSGSIEVKHLEGGSFHPYRRKWATERKHLPDKDVMLAGGWSDDRSLKASYQHSDHVTMLAVINEPRKLLEKKA